MKKKSGKTGTSNKPKKKSSKDTQKRVIGTNLIVANSFVELIRSSLGPLGSHKIIVDRDNFIMVTRDGRTIFENIEVIHPIEKILVNLTKSIDEEVGDGTTSAVIFTGALLSGALKLMELGLHPTTIVNGYQSAFEQAMENIEKLAVPMEDTMLKQVAFCSLNSKTLDQYKDMFSDMVVETVLKTPEISSVYFERVQGKSTAETELVDGLIIETQVMPPNVPTEIEDAKILLIDADVTFDEIKQKKWIELNIDDPSQIEDMHLYTYDFFKNIAHKIKETGANVVMNLKRMDSIVTDYLGEGGVLVTTNVMRRDVNRIARATGAKVVTDLDTISFEDLGSAKRVYQKKLSDYKFVYFELEDVATILIRGGSKQVIDETYQTLHDALHTTSNAFLHKAILPGGGATETYLSQAIKKYALSVKTKKQLAVLAYADALLTIPKTLAHNSGQDPISAVIELKKHHETDGPNCGLDVLSGEIVDTIKSGVIEPLITKKRIISGASQTAQLILRADDYIPKKRV